MLTERRFVFAHGAIFSLPVTSCRPKMGPVNFPSPMAKTHEEKEMSAEWNIYRTRFLIRAKQLTEPMVFIDFLGREHCGVPGDYLVESLDGTRRIAPRKIFEDIYVAMGPAEKGHYSGVPHGCSSVIVNSASSEKAARGKAAQEPVETRRFHPASRPLIA